jgi:uncharacterized protein YceK
MMRNLVALAMAAGLALAGCGSVETTGSAGDTAAVMAAAPVTAPADLPAFAPVYPGAQLTAATTQADGKGLIGFEAPATPAEIIDFYKGRGLSAGLQPMAEASTGSGQLLTMRRSDSQTAALQVTVTPHADGDVQVAVVYER